MTPRCIWILSCRWTLILILGFIGSTKILALMQGHASSVLPIPVTALIASAELMVATLLLLYPDRGSFLLATLLSGTLLLGSMAFRLYGLDLGSCGCLGPLKSSLQLRMLVAALMVVMAFLGLSLSQRKPATS